VWRIFGGAALVIAGVAGFILAHSDQPIPAIYEREYPGGPRHLLSHASGLSQGAYDWLRIGGWALVIVGGLLIITGLIAYWAAQSQQSSDGGEGT